MKAEIHGRKAQVLILVISAGLESASKVQVPSLIFGTRDNARKSGIWLIQFARLSRDRQVSTSTTPRCWDRARTSTLLQNRQEPRPQARGTC